MNIIRNFFCLLKKKLYAKKNNTSYSLKDLEKIGLEITPVSDSKVINKNKLISASQLPLHIFPWVSGMKNGTYLIKFPPEIQSQISSGFFNVTGGVARNRFGQIVSHGTSATSFLLLSPIILYQIGVIAFGVFYLKKINESLEKINKNLEDISSFLIDKRTAEINALILELLHISKGIIEFDKLGNLTEVLSRVDFIKQIRIKNLPNLLHLQKQLQDELNNLNHLKRESWFGSKKETQILLDSIAGYEIILVDYSRSLLLDIMCTEIEVVFSICNSSEEVKSRLSSQNSQQKFLKKQSSAFGKTLNNKFKELIKDSWCDDEIIEKKRKTIKASWNPIKKNITKVDTTYKQHIQSIEDKIKSKDNLIFLKKDEK